MHRSPVFIGSAVQWFIAAALLIACPGTLGPLDPLGAPATMAALVAGIGLFWLLAGRIMPLPRIERTSFQPLAIAALVVSLTAVAEETIWRGFAFHFLAAHTGIPFALGMTTLGFAAMHLYGQGWAGVTSHALTGAAFALALISSGQLVAAMLVHVTYNIAVAATSVAHDASWTG